MKRIVSIIFLFTISFLSLFSPISIKHAIAAVGAGVGGGIGTAVGAGVTSNDLANKINDILTYAMGLGGVVAFILIIVGAFQIILSAGSPDRVKAGKEMITSALAGLFLIIFSVLILKLVGVDILKLPDFGQ